MKTTLGTGDTLYGRGQTIHGDADETIFRLLPGSDRVVLDGFHFRGVKYGLLATEGERSKRIRLVNCTIEGNGKSGALFNGNGLVDHAELIHCHQNGDGRLLLTGAAIGWLAEHCTGYESFDTDAYFKGFIHVARNVMIRSAGKDGIKFRFIQCAKGGPKYGGNCLAIDCDVTDYGLIQPDAGAAINIEVPDCRVIGGHYRLNPREEVEEGRDYRAINLSKDAHNCIILPDSISVPEGDMYHECMDEGLNNRLRAH